jgi:hypothetical protein
MNNYIKIGICVFFAFAHMHTHTMEREPEVPTIDSCSNYSVSWNLNGLGEQMNEAVVFLNEDISKVAGKHGGKPFSSYRIDMYSKGEGYAVFFKTISADTNIKQKDISQEQWMLVQNALKFLINRSKEAQRIIGKMPNKIIDKNEPEWIYLYNTVASIVNNIFEKEKITIFMLEPKNEQSAPIDVPSPEQSSYAKAPADTQPTIDSCTYSVRWDFNNIQEDLPFQRIKFSNNEDNPPQPIGIIGENAIKRYIIKINENETGEYELTFTSNLPSKYTKTLTKDALTQIRDALTPISKRPSDEKYLHTISKNEPAWINLYNTVSSIINKIFEKEKITLFMLKPKNEQPTQVDVSTVSAKGIPDQEFKKMLQISKTYDLNNADVDIAAAEQQKYFGLMSRIMDYGSEEQKKIFEHMVHEEPSSPPAPEKEPQSTIETCNFKATWFFNNQENKNNMEQEKMQFKVEHNNDTVMRLTLGKIHNHIFSAYTIYMFFDPKTKTYTLDFSSNASFTQKLQADIDEKIWTMIKKSLREIQEPGTVGFSQKGSIAKVLRGNVYGTKVNIREFYNSVATTVNDIFKNDKLAIFELAVPLVQPSAHRPEQQPIQNQPTKNARLARALTTATTKEQERNRGLQYNRIFKYAGAGALAGWILSMADEAKTYLGMQPTLSGSQRAAGIAAAGAVGAAGAGLSLLRQYIFQAPAGFAEQLNLLNDKNISKKTVFIGGKEYLLALGLDKLEEAGYSTGKKGPHGNGQHYEIYVSPDQAHLVHLFLAILTELSTTYSALRDSIAFIALRPTPRVYNDSSFTGFFSREVLPHIVICLKSITDIGRATIVARDISQLICRLTTQVASSFQGRLYPKLHNMVPSGYQPRNSQTVTRRWREDKDKKTTDYTFAGFGSPDYKKYHKDDFERHYNWYGMPTADDMAYPKKRERYLKIELDPNSN